VNWRSLQVAIIMFVLCLHPSPTAAQDCTPQPKLDDAGFRRVMETLSAGWNRGNAKMAASCFTENAVYSSPPSSPRRGRKELYEFFGGAKGRKLPMRMTWHYLVFDPSQQIGVGEYTFQYQIQTHGIVIVKISNGLILNWREYEVESKLSWDQFIGENKF
jgi:hypothetical protein